MRIRRGIVRIGAVVVVHKNALLLRHVTLFIHRPEIALGVAARCFLSSQNRFFFYVFLRNWHSAIVVANVVWLEWSYTNVFFLIVFLYGKAPALAAGESLVVVRESTRCGRVDPCRRFLSLMVVRTMYLGRKLL